jgi:GH35 family endo-1,4-beta-xylanase
MKPHNRRNFIKKSTLAVLGSLAGISKINGMKPAMKKNSQWTRRDQNAFYISGSDGEILREARKAIRKNRMREVQLQLLDAKGKPRVNEAVEIVQKRHDFLFGDNNVLIDKLIRQGEAYEEKLMHLKDRYKNIFNAVNNTCYWTERPRNNMKKTEPYQGKKLLDSFAQSVNWTNAFDMTAKGHPLFWTVPKALPKWLKEYPYDTQWKFVEVRVRNMIARFSGRVKIWDVVNEALWEPALKNLDKRDWPYLETLKNQVEYIGSVLKWCREEDPEGIYLINDYGLSTNVRDNLRNSDGTLVDVNLQRKRYKQLAGALADNGTPPDGIGLQCHFGWQTPQEQLRFYDEMAEAGFPLHITEFWPSLGRLNAPELSEEAKREKQLQYVKDYLTIAFSHPAISSFFFWGFFNRAIDRAEGPSPALEAKPLYHEIYDLLHKEWKTHVKKTTDSDGFISFKGFYGDYALRYATKGKEQSQSGIAFNVNRQASMPLILHMSHL